MKLDLSTSEADLLIDALRDYAEGADKYEADDADEEAVIAGFADEARTLIARAEALREGEGS